MRPTSLGLPPNSKPDTPTTFRSEQDRSPEEGRTISNILIRILGNGADAKATIDDVDASVDKFGKKTAEAQIRVDADQAKREIAEVIAEAKAIPSEETIRIRVAGEQAKLQQLQQRAQVLEKALNDAAESGGDTDRIVQQLGNVNRAIDDSKSRILQLGKDFDNLGFKSSSALVLVTTGFKRARTALDGLVEHIPLIGGLSNTISNLVSKGLNALVTLLPTAAQGFGSMVAAGLSLASVVPIVLVLASALAALVVSLGEALLGVAALGVAFLAALGPIAIVLGLVVSKIKDIVSGQSQLASATANVKSALEAQKTAVTELQAAEQNESTQRLAALQAEQQAYFALRDAQDTVADDRLNANQAVLNLKQAKLDLLAFTQSLAGLGMSPGDLEQKAGNVDVVGGGQTQVSASQLAWEDELLQYQQLLQNIKTAQQGLPDSTEQLAEAIGQEATAAKTWSTYVEKGLKAYAPYAQALETTATAIENVASAIDHTNSAELSKQQAIKHGAGFAAGFIKAWDKIKTVLGKVFGPAEKAAFAGIESAMNIIAKHPKVLMELAGAFTELGRAIGGAFVQWAKDLMKPDNMKLIKTLVGDAAKLTTDWSGGMFSLFQLILEVAEAAMPTLLAIVKNLGTNFADVAKHPQDIKTFINECIGQTKLWWDRLKDVLSVVGKLAGDFQKVYRLLKDIGLVSTVKGAISVVTTGATPTLPGKGGNALWQAMVKADPALAKSAHAEGGVTAGPSMGLVGEAGPEAILPLTSQVFSQLAEQIGRYLTVDMGRVMGPTRVSAAGVSPASNGIHHTHNWHLNQGDTIASDEHFIGVVDRRMAGLAEAFG